MQTIRLAMVLAIAAASTPALADAPPAPSQDRDAPAVSDAASTTAEPADNDADAGMEKYRRDELALYDALSTDPSPRLQSLAGRIYVEDEDETPSALRPKRADVVARAVRFAPDDAFVQWMAASEGSFASSACGPTTWPEAEVANLVRLEPDNAAAWQFAVALARAKGDEAGVDDALSRMAGASRADDHLADELDAWTTAFETHREISTSAPMFWGSADLPPAQAALVAGLQRISYRSPPTVSSLQGACKPDAASERTWQRLGWCVDSARLLAEKGSSLALRKQGLDLLAAVGDRSDAITAMQRQHDWLDAHNANPLGHFDDSPESPDLLLADWHGATGEVAAIERHLRHLGLPATPPASWVKETTPADTDQTAADASAKKTMQAYAQYLVALFEDMRTSTKAEQRLFATLNDTLPAKVLAAAEERQESTTQAGSANAEQINEFADGNPDNLKVQWMIAGSGDPRIAEDTRAGAIARLQLAESDNAAAWALSLPQNGSVPAEIAESTLQRMAASTRYDAHDIYVTSTVLEAMAGRPIPDELLAIWSNQAGAVTTGETTARVSAIAMASAMVGAGLAGVMRECAPAAVGAPGANRRDACIATAKTMVDKSPSLLMLGVGESILRKLDALAEPEATRARRAWWWQQHAMPGADPAAISAYLDDYFASGNEIDAMQRAAERLGKTEPPAQWKSANERRAARAARK